MPLSASTILGTKLIYSAKWRRAFAHGAELDFRGAALIPRKSACEVRSTLRPLALSKVLLQLFHN